MNDITAQVRRHLFVPDGIRICADVEPDLDVTPSDFDCYSLESHHRWSEHCWEYVTISVHVYDRDGRELGCDALSSVESGWIDNETYADPLEYALSDDGSAGSPLFDVAMVALDAARTFTEKARQIVWED